MTQKPTPSLTLPACCYVECLMEQIGARWVLQDYKGVTLFAAPDFGAVMRRAHELGFKNACVVDGPDLRIFTTREEE